MDASGAVAGCPRHVRITRKLTRVHAAARVGPQVICGFCGSPHRCRVPASGRPQLAQYFHQR
jgi:hypothetical protein